MQQSDLGPFVLGGNVFGWTVDRAESFRILDAFLERGGRAIDTADMYSMWVPGNRGGESEELIGAWMAERGVRDRVFVASKVSKLPSRPGLSPANIAVAVEDSLRRLRTDHLDLYYAHEDDTGVPQADYLAAFDALVRAGKVRALGASNFTPDRLVSALRIARDNGLTAFTASQDHYNLVERDIERDLLPVLAREGIAELPYYALASGFLTGKYRPGAAIPASQRADGAARYLDSERNLRLLALLDELAAAHQVSVAAIALAWLRAQPTVGAPIASARTVDQLAPLFESATVALSADEVARLGDPSPAAQAPA